MFSLFRENHYKKANFEDVQYAIRKSNEFILLNTLLADEQSCLITGTINALSEEQIINDMIHSINTPDKRIIIYGKHSNDNSPYTKYKQLQNLGITDIIIYSGGMFEWLLLQDIYGMKAFPTTCKMIDILKYKPDRIL